MLWIIDKVERYPKSIKFSIGERIMTYSLDINEKIIEAIYKKEKKSILEDINLKLETLRILFRLSKDKKYISIQQYEFISSDLNEFGSMIGGWIKSL